MKLEKETPHIGHEQTHHLQWPTLPSAHVAAGDIRKDELMTTPNGPDQPGARPGLPSPEPPYNPRPSVPRSVILGGAAAVVAVIVVVILVVSLSGGGDESPNGASDGAETSISSNTETPRFAPVLSNAAFTRSGWYDKATQEPVAPPQRITITGSIDLRADVESIGYGPVEQSMPKIAKYADTDSSFPRNPAVTLLVDDKGSLRMFWSCETMYDKPVGANCGTPYNLTLDISGTEPVVVSKATGSVDYGSESTTSSREEDGNMSVSNPDRLPSSTLASDERTGATTAMVLGAVQPNESRSKVYFVVPDSLELYVGELESSR